MGLAERTNPIAVWRERFRWLTPYYLASGALALVLATAYEKVGITGLLAFCLPPAFMMLSVRLYLIRTRESVDEVRRANAELERANEELTELAERVRRTHRDTIAALSRSMEAKDYYTGGHTERVSEIAVALAVRLGFTGDDLEAVEIGALLHDIGKIGIPEQILHKPAPLDDEEWKVMKEHPVVSDFILSEIELHPFVRQIARSSHERLDGAGYPDGLAGDEIPLVARIVFVADAFDAITTDRPYRPGRSTEEALGELRGNSGTQFCPRVVRALEQLYLEEPTVLMPETPSRPRLVSAA
jgi:putative nucleotidyltransferase with HDIG domain